ncbi:MAG TPA: toxin-antitoxin system HicB family antitoxin [Gemmatimonadaceae bacterium]|jgi:uncharacterized protein (DUF1778 family)
MSAISLRLPDSIHQKIKELAERDRTSINQFIATAAAEKVAALEAEQYLAERARRGQRQRFLELLAKAPAVEPEEIDRIPGVVQRVSEPAHGKAGKVVKPSRRRKSE